MSESINSPELGFKHRQKSIMSLDQEMVMKSKAKESAESKDLRNTKGGNGKSVKDYVLQ